jgi:Phage capsid family
MTLAEKMLAMRNAMVATKDAITALTLKDSLDESELLQLEELNATSERQVKEYATYDRAEKALAAGALPAISGGAGAGGGAPARGAPAIATRGHLSRKEVSGFDILVRNALVVYEAHVTHDTVERIIERRYGDDLHVVETSKLLAYGGVFSKNLQNPAFTNVQGWAQELVRDGYAAFKEALAAEAVVPRLPLDNYEFDNYGKITIPFRTPGAKPNLAGAFRAEGAPIRVGRTTLSSKYLTPKSMGVIGTFSKELLKRSTPNIEEAIKKWMLEDTAISLDGIFFDAVVGDVIRPAGLRYGIAAGDTGASSGNLPNNIDADIMARISQLASYHMLKRPVWVMNPVNAIALSFAKTATGDPAYPTMSEANGTLAKMPVYSATTIPADVVFLLDAAFIGFAGGAPTFEGSDQATVHEDDGDPNADGKTGASVLPIVAGGTAATPVRSFFQTNTAGVKATWELDWAVEQPGAVQVITGVAWGTPVTP